MEHRISATELARRLGDVLARVRYKGDSFLVERNGNLVARIVPVPESVISSLREGLTAWRTASEADPAFADDLERIGGADRSPRNPWDS